MPLHCKNYTVNQKCYRDRKMCLISSGSTSRSRERGEKMKRSQKRVDFSIRKQMIGENRKWRTEQQRSPTQGMCVRKEKVTVVTQRSYTNSSMSHNVNIWAKSNLLNVNHKPWFFFFLFLFGFLLGVETTYNMRTTNVYDLNTFWLINIPPHPHWLWPSKSASTWN